MGGFFSDGELPFQSVYSVLMRTYRHTVWRLFDGAFDMGAKLYGAQRTDPGIESVKRNRDDSEQHVVLGQWDQPLLKYLCAHPFKFCPICLERQYHSYLQQLNFLSVCPLHQCRLVTSCQCCGKGTFFFRDGPARGVHPYLCSRCMSPLAGAPIEFLQDFERSDDISRAFGALNEWCVTIQKPLQRLDSIEWFEWIDGCGRYGGAYGELLLAACERVLPLPPGLATSSFRLPSVSVLVWTTPDINWPKRMAECGEIPDSMNLGRAVYRLVVRRIERVLEADAHRPLTRRAVHRQAYQLFRERHETGNTRYRGPRLPEVVLAFHPHWTLPYWGFSRASWFAYFVGMFALAVFLVDSRGDRSDWHLKHILANELKPSAGSFQYANRMMANVMVVPTLNEGGLASLIQKTNLMLLFK